MRALSQILTCAAAAMVVGAHAADEEPQTQYLRPGGAVELPPKETFRELFKGAFDRRLDLLFADRFHPFHVMNWSIELADGEYDALRERASSAARGALAKSIQYSLRDAAVDLPIMLWLQERQGAIGDFLLNTIGSVEEEAVAPLDVSYRLVERSWWERVAENRELRYGIRPLGTSPYAFLSMALKDGDGLLLLGHLRYHYRRFADHHFEFAVSVPLEHGFAIDLGTSYQFGRHDDEAAVVIKLFKQFNHGGIVHVGLEVREHPALFAGLAFPW